MLRDACHASEFTDPRGPVDLFGEVTAPGGALCGIVVHGWREPEHSVYLTRDGAAFRAVVRVHGLSPEPPYHEAPLDQNIGAMLQRICNAVVATHSQCHHYGRDGTYYLMQVSTDGQDQRTALTWSPKPGTDSDLVVTMFLALRAYVGAPPDLQLSAYNTFYTEAYEAYNALGLFETAHGARR